MIIRSGGIKTMVVAISLLAPLPVPAQTDAGTLPEIEELALTGRADEARAALLAWWEESRGLASREELQHALWLRGRLTIDPSQAVRDFQRLVVEYPFGPFTDRALYRLAQEAYERRDTEEFERHMASLSRDYPGSSVLADAEAWVRGVQLAPPPLVVRAAIPEATFEDQDDAVMQSDTTRYSVQLGAFSNEGRASALFDLARAADLNVRLVRMPGSSLIHVRVGRFGTSMEATVFSRRVTGLGFTAAVVRDTRDEERVRSSFRVPNI
jgi:hypothetical protein